MGGGRLGVTGSPVSRVESTTAGVDPSDPAGDGSAAPVRGTVLSKRYAVLTVVALVCVVLFSAAGMDAQTEPSDPPLPSAPKAVGLPPRAQVEVKVSAADHFILPWATSAAASDGLHAIRATSRRVTAAVAKQTALSAVHITVASAATRHCQPVGRGTITGAITARAVVVQAWPGHEAVLGCTLAPVAVEWMSPARTADAQLNHLVVSVSAPSPADDAKGACRVDFIAAVSVSMGRARDCAPNLAASAKIAPPTNGSGHAFFAAMKFGPNLVKTSFSPALEYVAIELTQLSTVIPFVVARRTPLERADDTRLASLLPYDDEPQPLTKTNTAGPALDAPVRCDQGLYMGFTNIIEALVACVIFSALGGRNHVEFPGRFHHESFATLFDAELIQRGALERYGVSVKLLPRESSVVSHNHLHFPYMPKLTKNAPAFAMAAALRPGARLFTGDVWKSRINTLTEHHQTRWFAEGVFSPAPQLSRFSSTLIEKMRGLAAVAKEGGTQTNASVASVAATAEEGPWAAMHLRLEDDRFTMGKKAEKAGGDTLSKIKEQLRSHFRGDDAVPAFYASGDLPKPVVDRLPANWRNKNDFFDRKYWTQMYQGVWFNGRIYDITNATGSLVDMFVLLEAPFSVLSEFSSFGEYVAALRCGKGKPSVMYDTKGDFFAVDCGRLILFQRGWHEQNRQLGCHTLKAQGLVLTRQCEELNAAHGLYQRNVAKLDYAIAEAVTALKKRRP
jgi:hypothetical protein